MGSNFIHRFLSVVKNASVINLDALTYAGNQDNLLGVPQARYSFVKGDICDTALVEKLMSSVDFVVNFAAETHVDRSIHGGADAFIQSNIIGVHSLMKALQKSPRVKKMVHVSTDEVWGDLPLASKKKFNEDSPLKPNSPYAASKAAAELLIRAYVHTYGVPVVISRSVNNFGPRQFPEKLIPFFTVRALHDESLPLYGDGRNMRDWLYVDDHTDALLLLLQKSKSGDTFGISEGKEYSNKIIAQKILSALRKPQTLITFVKDRPAHDRKYAVDSSRLRRLGWKPKYSLENKLPDVLQWYKENNDWVENILKRKKEINSHLKLS